MAALVMLESMFRHKRRARRRRQRVPDTVSSTTKALTDGTSGSMKCRICLKNGKISIFQNDTHENFANDIRKFGEIELTEQDGLPKVLCGECYGLLLGALRFRKLAQHSDRILRTPEIKPRSIANHSDDCDTNNDEGLTWHDDDDDDRAHHSDDDNRKKDSSLFRCRKCKIGFENVEELVEHRKSESHRKPRVQCPECSLVVYKGSLRAHVTRFHTRAEPHMCDVCGKSFIMKGNLTRHLLTHTDELPFACGRCPYRCRYSASLKEHTRVHTGERPYACHRCPARFPNSSNLKKHSRTHLTQHQYKCTHCDKGFHTQHKMKAHIKVDHMGLKEHVCDICGKEFGYKVKLGQHLRIVHKRPKKRLGRLPLYLEIDEKMNQQNGNAETACNHTNI